MNSILYYFTGTGNSLSVARKISERLGDAELISIVSQMKTDEIITAPSGRVGIICPVYDAGIPVMVRDFLHRLKIGDGSYVFGVVTLGGTGGSALKMMDKALSQMNTHGLHAGFIIKMPGNFPPVSSPPSGEKIDSILSSADKEITRITELIRECKKQKIGMYPISSLMQAALYGGFARGVHTSDERFSVSGACTSCGTCVSVCPTENITLEDGKPVYHHRCELCCACLNFCPVQAIDLNLMRGTKGRGRYHHPEVTVRDMRGQK